MSDFVTVEVDRDVAFVTIDNPPMNSLSPEVRDGLNAAFERVESDPEIKAAVLTCAGRTFVVGADIKMFDNLEEDPGFIAAFARIEACSKPVVAALFGNALGGGLELALACHYRVADSGARLGFPEITLGVVPGAGGTQRAPRLIGVEATLDMMISGRPLGAADAKEKGLVDAVPDGDVKDAAADFARRMATEGQGPRRTAEMTADASALPANFFQDYKDKIAYQFRGRQVHEWIVDAVKAATEKPFEEGMTVEQELSQASIQTPESKALRHLFFAERAVSKIPGLPEGIEPQSIKNVALVGAGTMGTGIAMAFANAGYPVTLTDVDREKVDKGLETIRKAYESRVKRGRMPAERVDKLMGLITGAVGTEQTAGADLVIEAVFEDMDLKKQVFKTLTDVCGPATILATNTSTLDINEIAAVTDRPEKVVGLHFFSPAQVMPLLEIVRAEKTSYETLVTALDIGKKIRKIGVVAGVCFGFIGNRMMLDGYIREAEQLLLEGASPEQVDRALEDFGFAMGPSRVNDMGGIDVGYRARQELFKHDTRPDPYWAVSDALYDMGRLGQKTGKGVYRYEEGDRTPRPDPEVTEVIEKLAAERNITRRAVSDEEIVERCVLALVNVGADILDEGIAYRAADIDVVWTSGYGFPRFRGGPMFYADSLGIQTVYEKIQAYHERLGHYWTPSDLLKRLAAEGRSFADWDEGR